jgi:hypothetical protein
MLTSTVLQRNAFTKGIDPVNSVSGPRSVLVRLLSCDAHKLSPQTLTSVQHSYRENERCDNLHDVGTKYRAAL